jgi:DnaJ-class molecular chaperone
MIKKIPDTWTDIQLALAYEAGWRRGYQDRDPDHCTDAELWAAHVDYFDQLTRPQCCQLCRGRGRVVLVLCPDCGGSGIAPAKPSEPDQK